MDTAKGEEYSFGAIAEKPIDEEEGEYEAVEDV